MDDDLNPAFADPVIGNGTGKSGGKKKKFPKYAIWLLVGCLVALILFTLIYKLAT
ncbi:hypothetical protein KBD45_06110 [Candidatus Dojkabacteria bacterium]|nr:hypothetical protein [Candidatus Dojkabacteria bacterium]